MVQVKTLHVTLTIHVPLLSNDPWLYKTSEYPATQKWCFVDLLKEKCFRKSSLRSVWLSVYAFHQNHRVHIKSSSSLNELCSLVKCFALQEHHNTMPPRRNLSDTEREWARPWLAEGVTVCDIGRRPAVSYSVIVRLNQRVQESARVQETNSRGRSRVNTAWEDRYIEK